MEKQKSKSSTSPPPLKTTRWCSGCQAEVERSEFSKTQMKKKVAKCKTCCGGGGGGSGSKGGNQSNGGSSGNDNQRHRNNHNRPNQKQQQTPREPTPISLSPRPQIAVPGFKGLSVCRDWPQTKNGRPPNSQSLVFAPLLACSLQREQIPLGEDPIVDVNVSGAAAADAELDGYCTQEQLKLAFQWWTLAMPSWPKWTKELSNILQNNTNLRRRLLKTAKGQPCALIPKAKGRGTVPHFNGRIQEEILEMAPTTALEIYACVTCIYSAAAMMANEKQ